MTRTGETIPVEISVREVIQDGKRTYIGYARDLRADLEARNQATFADRLNDLSPVAVLVIDGVGTILKANREASDFFQWPLAELEGGEIERLQPPDVARQHKFFLNRYLEDGIKRVVDQTRSVVAQKRDGTLVPVEIMVKELDLVGRGKVFVGSVTDVTEKVALGAFVQVNEAIQDLVQEAMICMTQIGTILKFNAQASVMFKCKPEDIIGKNIKSLMPADTAKDHDSYLKRYLDTGVKRVVDTTREVVAQTVAGDPFDASIMVKEVKIKAQAKKDDTDDEERMESIYIGFIIKDA
jgi:two-component system sensor kinase FixL